MSSMWCIPTVLTSLRLGAVPFLWWAALAQRWDIAFGLFCFAALSDVFDGRIARRFGCVTTFGALFDPLVDKVFMVSLYAIMFFLPTMMVIPSWFFWSMVVKELLLSVGAWYFGLVRREVVISAAVPGKVAGVVQGFFALYWLGSLAFGRYLFSWFGVMRGLLLLVWAMRLFYVLMVASLVVNMAAFLFYLFSFFSQRTLDKK